MAVIVVIKEVDQWSSPYSLVSGLCLRFICILQCIFSVSKYIYRM